MDSHGSGLVFLSVVSPNTNVYVASYTTQTTSRWSKQPMSFYCVLKSLYYTAYTSHIHTTSYMLVLYGGILVKATYSPTAYNCFMLCRFIHHSLLPGLGLNIMRQTEYPQQHSVHDTSSKFFFDFSMYVTESNLQLQVLVEVVIHETDLDHDS